MFLLLIPKRASFHSIPKKQILALEKSMLVVEEPLLMLNLILLIEMEKISAKVKMVQYQSNQDFSNVRVTVDKEFDAIIAKRDDENRIIDGEWIEAKINYLDFAPSALTAILCNLNEDIAFLRSISEVKFTQAEFGAILFGAEIEFTREFVENGHVIPSNPNGKVATRDCYDTVLTKIKVGDKTKLIIEKMTMAKLGL